MNGDMKLEKLEDLYRIHENHTAPSSMNSACVKGCATCCTRNVTLTSVEAALLLSGLDAEEKNSTVERLAAHSKLQRLTPLVTVNAMARLCMNGEDLPEEACDPSWGPCPLLELDGSCSIYVYRPFACRAMASRATCGVSGEADMDDYLFTLNNVFMQTIEHLDQGGAFANMTDMLTHLTRDETMASYKTTGIHPDPPAPFLKNEPMSVLLIPPEHRTRILPLIESLKEWI